MYINEYKLNRFIEDCLLDDIRDGDHTSLAIIPKEKRSTAHLFIKDQGIIAGIVVAKKIFAYVDPSSKFKALVHDGESVHNDQIAFEVEINTRAFLKVERMILNILSSLSGIATFSNKVHTITKKYNVTVMDARKGTPLFRFLERWAVTVGGCKNSREGLFDRILIQDNHINVAGSIENAINLVVEYQNKTWKKLPVSIEVQNLSQLQQTLVVGNVNRIVLDNFTHEQIVHSIELVCGNYEIEVAGGINYENIEEIAKLGVPFISVGALTHSIKILDFSMKIV